VRGQKNTLAKREFPWEIAEQGSLVCKCVGGAFKAIGME